MKLQKKLGEILLEAGLISATQLKAALGSQQRWGGRIGEHLVKAGHLTETQLLDALSLQLGVAKINFERSQIFKDALETVPRQVCLKYHVVPVAVRNEGGRRKLLLAMADPTNYKAIQEVEFVSGHSVVTALALENDIQRAIEHCYHASGIRESRGLGASTGAIDLDSQIVGTNEETIIISPEGEFVERDKRATDNALRVLVDLLVEKRLISREEFRERLKSTRG